MRVIVPVNRDPAVNLLLHPESNPRIDPRRNSSLDPTVNGLINPHVATGLNPTVHAGLTPRTCCGCFAAPAGGAGGFGLGAPVWRGGSRAEVPHFVWTTKGVLEHYTLGCADECQRVYSLQHQHVGTLLPNGGPGYNLFDLKAVWLAYWVPTGLGGFLCFSPSSAWTHFTT